MLQPTIVLLAAMCMATPTRADPIAAAATWPSGASAVDNVAFSPDSKLLASVGDSTLKLWNVADHKELGSATELINTNNLVRFSADGAIVYALGRGDSLVRLATDTGKPMEPIALKTVGGHANAFDVSPDGKSIAVVGRGSLRVLSSVEGTEQQNWEVHANYGINAVAFSPDGKCVATAATDHKSLLVEIATGKIVWEMPLPLNGTAVAFSHDGKTLFIGSSDGTLMSFDLSSGEGKTILDQKVTIGTLAATPDGESLFVGGTNRQPWRIALPANTPDENPLAGGVSNTALAVSPDGKFIAGGWMDGSLCLWKLGN